MYTCEDNTAVLYARQNWPKITFKLLLKRHLNGYNYNITRATATKFSVYMLFGERFLKNMFSVRCAVPYMRENSAPVVNSAPDNNWLNKIGVFLLLQ